MKKLSKLMALLLSLLMIVSLFAACGDDKKKDKDDDKKEETTVAANKNDKEDKEDEEDIEYEEEEDDDDDENLTGEALLIGDWFYEMESDGIDFVINFYFEEDGTAECFLMETVYNDVIDQIVEITMADYTEEDAIAEGYTSLEEMAEDLKTYLTEEEMPYEVAATDFAMEGTWELDGDTLTLTNEDGDKMVAETELSEGARTFIFVNEDGEELVLSKD